MHQQSTQASGEAKDLIEGEGDEIGLVNRQVQGRGAHIGGCVQQHVPLPRHAHRARLPGLDLFYPGQRVSGPRKVTLSWVTEEMHKLAVGIAGGRTLLLRQAHVLWPDRHEIDVLGSGDHPHAHHGGVVVGEVTEQTPATLWARGRPREGLCHQFQSSCAPGCEDHTVVVWGGVKVCQNPGSSTAVRQALGLAPVPQCLGLVAFLLNMTSLYLKQTYKHLDRLCHHCEVRAGTEVAVGRDDKCMQTGKITSPPNSRTPQEKTEFHNFLHLS